LLTVGLSLFVLPLLPPKSVKSREIARKIELIEVQGHPRLSIESTLFLDRV